MANETQRKYDVITSEEAELALRESNIDTKNPNCFKELRAYIEKQSELSCGKMTRAIGALYLACMRLEDRAQLARCPHS